MSHKRKVVLRVGLGLLGVCAISALATYVVLGPARAIGPGQQHNTEPEPESEVLPPDPATVDMNGTLYRCVCGSGGATIEISVAKESESESDAALPNSACWVDCDGTFCRCVCGSGEVSIEVSVPTLTLSPDTGTPGQPIRVNGARFARETSVVLRLGVPNAGLSKENLATIVVDAHGAFEVELTLPVEWPGAQTPIVERELVIAAVDEVRGQTLAVAEFTNAAVVRFVETIAEEVREHNVQINCVGPGQTYTHMTDLVLKAGERAGARDQEEAEKVRMTGGTKPEEQLELARFLASEDSNHVSGKYIRIRDDWRRLLTGDVNPALFTLRRVRKI